MDDKINVTLSLKRSELEKLDEAWNQIPGVHSRTAFIKFAVNQVTDSEIFELSDTLKKLRDYLKKYGSMK